MYNSKKALELAILEYEKDLEYEETNQWVENVLKGLKDLKQDLEKLEKENKELRKSIKSWNENGGNLLKENIKLKKAIEILKRFDFDIYTGACLGFVDPCIKEPLTFDLDDYEELQQYELIKEVLK